MRRASRLARRPAVPDAVAMAPSGDAARAATGETAGFPLLLARFAAMNITPTRLPGARAALLRHLATLAYAVSRIPAWQGVTLVMSCAAAAMVAVAPAPLLV